MSFAFYVISHIRTLRELFSRLTTSRIFPVYDIVEFFQLFAFCERLFHFIPRLSLRISKRLLQISFVPEVSNVIDFSLI